jgi:hypothetical protein
MGDGYKRIPRTTREAFGPSWASISGPYKRTVDLARVVVIGWVAFMGGFTLIAAGMLAVLAWWP